MTALRPTGDSKMLPLLAVCRLMVLVLLVAMVALLSVAAALERVLEGDAACTLLFFTAPLVLDTALLRPSSEFAQAALAELLSFAVYDHVEEVSMGLGMFEGLTDACAGTSPSRSALSTMGLFNYGRIRSARHVVSTYLACAAEADCLLFVRGPATRERSCAWLSSSLLGPGVLMLMYGFCAFVILPPLCC